MHNLKALEMERKVSGKGWVVTIATIVLLLGVWYLTQTVLGPLILEVRYSLLRILWGLTKSFSFIICAIGLLRLKRWARVLLFSIMVYFFSIVIYPLIIFIERMIDGYIFSVFLGST
jgi:hypothetical protein